MQAFDAGDYEKARVLFEMLTENADTEGLRRKAFFALASTRLVLAQTPEEFNQAMATWDCWRRQFPHPMEGEDPRHAHSLPAAPHAARFRRESKQGEPGAG